MYDTDHIRYDNTTLSTNKLQTIEKSVINANI